METKWLQANQIDEAVQLLLQGEVVAFPTETVYGLGAVATDRAAVQKVFQAKQRPSDNPLIVHVDSFAKVREYVATVPIEAEQLAAAFWPGPLTLILRARPAVFPAEVSANLTTVAFRMPNHPLALELIEKTGKPLVGPSANRSGRPSPTSAAHVWSDLNGVIAGICDGGSSAVGIESTVLDVSTPECLAILRPGVITQEQIEAVLKRPLCSNQAEREATNDEAVRENVELIPKAPGMKYRHYAPRAQVIALPFDLDSWHTTIVHLQQQGKTVAAMGHDALVTKLGLPSTNYYCMGSQGDIDSMIYHLFSGLRALDAREVDVIIVESVENEGVGLAYMNRLSKAVSKK